MRTDQGYVAAAPRGSEQRSTPPSNTGVLSGAAPVRLSLDWLSATSDCTPERLCAVVGALVKEKASKAVQRETRPTNAYADAVEWVQGDKRLAMVAWGGVNHGRPHVTVPGAGGLSGFVRQELATSGYGFTTRASRVDVALDFRDVEFTALSALCGRPSRRIENADPDAGDTHYFGSRTSRFFTRVYEKGKQMGLPHLHDWVRVEHEIKPDSGAGREAVMRASLPELVRSGRVGRQVADAVGLVADDLRLGAASPAVDHGLMRRLVAMRHQYGPLIEELAAACGEDQDLFLDLLFYGPSEASMLELAEVSGSPISDSAPADGVAS